MRACECVCVRRNTHDYAKKSINYFGMKKKKKRELQQAINKKKGKIYWCRNVYPTTNNAKKRNYLLKT